MDLWSGARLPVDRLECLSGGGKGATCWCTDKEAWTELHKCTAFGKASGTLKLPQA